MNMEKMIETITTKKNLITTHVNLLEAINHNNAASIDCRGNWRIAIDTSVAKEIVDKQLESLQEELGRLEEAKKAAEITMEGWLNQSRGV